LSEELSCAPSLERWFGRKKLQWTTRQEKWCGLVTRFQP
jgi:hypothetical protein